MKAYKLTDKKGQTKNDTQWGNLDPLIITNQNNKTKGIK